MRKPLKLTALLLLCALLLTACRTDPTSVPGLALPTIAPGPEAPIGDAGLQHEAIIPLYLPSRDGQSLLTFYERLTLSRDQHPAEAILRALLTHEGNNRVRSLGGALPLSLSGANPVELSGAVCTVNLSANALMLSGEDLYTAALCIAATLCELEDVQYVTVLVAGTPVAMDVSGNLPLGALNARLGQELPVLWEQLISRRTPVGELPSHTPLTATAALYFPLEDSSGIAAEPRRLTFPGQHPQQMVVELLHALSNGAELLDNAADMPDLNALLLFVPEVTDLENGGRRATLHFTADVQDRLRALGCDPACVFASITTTLTTFVPSLQQVCIQVGDGALTSLYSDTLGSLLFPGALQTRASFSHALRGQSTIFIPEEGRLSTRTISLPYRSADNPRSLLLRMSSLGAIPEGLTDADILGLSVQDGTLLVNLSSRYADIIQDSPADQRLTAYSMVNTLCDALELRRVRFYFGSTAMDHLGGDLVWSGEFLYNPGLIGGTP